MYASSAAAKGWQTPERLQRRAAAKIDCDRDDEAEELRGALGQADGPRRDIVEHQRVERKDFPSIDAERRQYGRMELLQRQPLEHHEREIHAPDADQVTLRIGDEPIHAGGQDRGDCQQGEVGSPEPSGPDLERDRILRAGNQDEMPQ